MRVIAGSSGGVRLKVPAAVSRPTADRVREALFSVLGARVAGARVLDLYAGSGALGIEALSRGAAAAVFVEQNGKAARIIEENLAAAKVAAHARVAVQGVEGFLKGALAGGQARYDLIFADPPYKKRPGDPDHAAALLRRPDLGDLLEEGGMIVLETIRARDGAAAAFPPPWRVAARKAYGDTEVTFLTCEASER